MNITYKCFVACRIVRVQFLLTSCPYISRSAEIKDGLTAFYNVDYMRFMREKTNYWKKILKPIRGRKGQLITNHKKYIVNVWNSLPERVVMSKSVTNFRHQVNKLHFCVYCGTC